MSDLSSTCTASALRPGGSDDYWTTTPQRGIEQGRVEGREEGREELLRELLIRKFGPLSGTVDAALSEATIDQLRAWSVRLIDGAADVEEVFGEGGKDQRSA